MYLSLSEFLYLSMFIKHCSVTLVCFWQGPIVASSMSQVHCARLRCWLIGGKLPEEHLPLSLQSIDSFHNYFPPTSLDWSIKKRFMEFPKVIDKQMLLEEHLLPNLHRIDSTIVSHHPHACKRVPGINFRTNLATI